MIQTIIEALDLAANEALPVVERSGLAELLPVGNGTAPHVYADGGQWTQVATDASGTWSYWRLTAPITEVTAPGTSCTNDFKATYQLRLVMCVDREVCPVVIDAARSVMSAVRGANPWTLLNLRRTSTINAVRAEVDGARVYQQEFGQQGNLPPNKVLIAIDVTVVAIGRPECFEPCGPVRSLLCAAVSTASWQRIKACMTAGQIADAEDDLCDGPVGPCDDAAVTWDNGAFLTIPSGDTENINCNTLVNAAFVTDGGSVTGAYRVTGTENGREVFTLDASHSLRYTGTRWRLVKPGQDIDAALGTETKPWDADWSGHSITVEQATIGAYCDDCEPTPTTVNGVEIEGQTVTVTQGGVEVGTVDPVTGEVVVDECPECDPLTITVGRATLTEVPDPCGETVAISVIDRNGTNVDNIELDGLDIRIMDLPCAPVTVQLRDSAANNIGAPDVYPAGTTTTKTAPDGSVQRRDSAGTAIGGAIPVRSGQAGLDVTCPDGVVTIRNSVPTTLHTVSVRSNGAATQAIADSTITRPDGTTVGLPATLPFDVRDLRSGIVYNFGRVLHSGLSGASPFRTGDEISMLNDGFFNYTRPAYPTHFAELATFTTLVNNNMYGNTLRFTQRDNGGAASGPLDGNRWIRDHYLGVDLYALGTLLTGNWNTAVDSAITLRTTLGEGDIYHVNDRILDMITDGNFASPLNYLPFDYALMTNFWTSTTNRANTANALFLTPTGAFGNGVAKTTATLLYGIYVKRFA